MGETISAVVWFSDLRGFTALSESLPNTALLDHLNTYFELTGAAVTKEGGEILKFIGDGVLAIFDITPDADTADRCAAALRAARVWLSTHCVKLHIRRKKYNSPTPILYELVNYKFRIITIICTHQSYLSGIVTFVIGSSAQNQYVFIIWS